MMNTPALAYAVLTMLLTGKCLCDVASSSSNASTALYTKLYRALKKDYERAVFPANDLPVQVQFTCVLLRIVDLVEKEETLVTQMMTYVSWVDDRMRWNTSDFGGIKDIAIPVWNLWIPDITLYNDVAQEYTMVKTHGVQVRSDGQVFVVPYTTLRSHCQVDLRRFPFDTQTCSLKFGSWMYGNDKVNISVYDTGIDLSSFTPNAEWDLLSSSGDVLTLSYPCCPEGYPEFNVNLTLQRRSGIFNYMFVSPAVLFSLLTPVLFVIPPSSGERTTLGAMILVSMVILLQTLDNHLPAQQVKAPVIGIYYTCIIVFSGLALTLSAFIMNVKSRGTRQNGVPILLRKILLGPLKRVVFLDSGKFRPYNNMTSTTGERQQPIGGASDTTPAKKEGHALAALEAEVNELVKQVKSYNQIRERRQMLEDIVSDWQEVVLVLDRVLFAVFLLLIIIVTMSLLL